MVCIQLPASSTPCQLVQPPAGGSLQAPDVATACGSAFRNIVVTETDREKLIILIAV